MPGDSPPPPPSAEACPKRPLPALRRYWAALAFGIAGVAVAGIAGWRLDAWAQARDWERFAHEARLAASMVEQKMERYESLLGRVADLASPTAGRVDSQPFRHYLAHTLGIRDHFPNFGMMVLATRVATRESTAFQKSATDALGPGFSIRSTRPEGDDRLPVWFAWTVNRLRPVELGTDLDGHDPATPDMAGALGEAFAWISDRPAEIPLREAEGSTERGFWVAMPLRSLEATQYFQWQRPSETGEEAGARRRVERARQAKGLLAAFISGGQFLAQFNSGSNAMVHLRLYTGPAGAPETLLNPTPAPPAHPRFETSQVTRWYGRRWTLRVAGTPRFDDTSLRYRARLAWWLGIPLSLGGAAVMAWQTRSRWQQADLAMRLRETLARQERLSRDLHDGTLQSIYGIGLGLQRSLRLAERRPQEAFHQLRATATAVHDAILELRTVLGRLDDSGGEPIALAEALQAVLTRFQAASEATITADLAPGADAGLSPAESLHLLNIAREAVSNAIRHARATHIHVRLKRDPRLLHLEVSDDGTGFDPDSPEGEGRGLRHVAARGAELGADIQWASRPGSGSTLHVALRAPSAPGSTHTQDA